MMASAISMMKWPDNVHPNSFLMSSHYLYHVLPVVDTGMPCIPPQLADGSGFSRQSRVGRGWRILSPSLHPVGCLAI